MNSLSGIGPSVLSIFVLFFADASAEVVPPDRRGYIVPDRNFDIEALELDLDLDPVEESIAGSATYRISRLGPGDFVLDQVGLDITRVSVGDDEVDWWVRGHHLHIDIVTDEATVRIDYSARPDAGLHFRHSERSTVDEFDEVWSQGQSNDNRYWFPCWDHPNDRFHYEGTIRAPEGWRVLTNSGVELPSYLVMLAAGTYEIHTHPDDETISVWVGPGTSEEAVDGVLTPLTAMMAHFEMRSGVEYPWGPYRQVFAQRFLYGGMENTSATINTDTLLVSHQLQRTRMRVDGIVAHELAHQWYGDLLTCRTWRELWLNEGFATFMTGDWVRESRGEVAYGATVRSWFDDSLGHGAMAGRFHQGPDSARSYNVYSKGASVLQMLRVLLGEEVFWTGIRHYTRENRDGGVDTYNLRRALEDVSGMHLDWFFQQWVELPHVPEIEVSHSYADGELSVTIQQEVEDERPLYTIPIWLEVGTEDGPIRIEDWMETDRRVVTLELDSPPRYVAFDPEGGVLARSTVEQDPEEWVAQFESGHPYARLRALEALGDTDQSDELAVWLMDETLDIELRLGAARALGEQRAFEPLLAARTVDSDRLRQQVMRSLGRCHGEEVADALAWAVRRDEHPDVVSSALSGLGEVDTDRAVRLSRTRARIREREQLTIRDAAVGILGEYGEVSDLRLILDSSGPVRARHWSLWAALDLVSRQESAGVREALSLEIARFAEQMLEDDDLRARWIAIETLNEIGDTTSIPILESYRRSEGVLRLQDRAVSAIAAIRARDGEATELSPNEMEARLEALEERLDELEAEVRLWEERH